MRGWSLWHDRHDIPQRFESGQSGWSESRGLSIRRSGRRTPRSRRSCCTSETLRRWVRQAKRDTGHRAGLTTDERQRLKELEREVRELKRANEILRKASAYFAQAELDRRVK